MNTQGQIHEILFLANFFFSKNYFFQLEFLPKNFWKHIFQQQSEMFSRLSKCCVFGDFSSPEIFWYVNNILHILYCKFSSSKTWSYIRDLWTFITHLSTLLYSMTLIHVHLYVHIRYSRYLWINDSLLFSNSLTIPSFDFAPATQIANFLTVLVL